LDISAVVHIGYNAICFWVCVLNNKPSFLQFCGWGSDCYFGCEEFFWLIGGRLCGRDKGI